MPYIILPDRRIRQPQNDLRIDWRNPLTRGLLGIAGNPQKQELISNVLPVLSGAFSIGARPPGIAAIAPSSQVPGYVSWTVPTINIGASQDYTIVAYAQRSSDNITTSYTQNFIGSNVNAFLIGTPNFSAFIDNNLSNTIATSGGYHLYAATRVGNQNTPYIDGIPAASNVTGTRAQAITQILIGRDTTNNNWANTETFILGVWGRALSQQELIELSRNPWQIFRPDRRISYFTVGGGATYTKSTSLSALLIPSNHKYVYVNTDSVGGTGLTSAITGTDAAYSSLNSCLTTHNFSATNTYFYIYCVEGSTNGPDNTKATTSGLTLGSGSTLNLCCNDTTYCATHNLGYGADNTAYHYGDKTAGYKITQTSYSDTTLYTVSSVPMAVNGIVIGRAGTSVAAYGIAAHLNNDTTTVDRDIIALDESSVGSNYKISTVIKAYHQKLVNCVGIGNTLTLTGSNSVDFGQATWYNCLITKCVTGYYLFSATSHSNNYVNCVSYNNTNDWVNGGTQPWGSNSFNCATDKTLSGISPAIVLPDRRIKQPQGFARLTSDWNAVLSAVSNVVELNGNAYPVIAPYYPTIATLQGVAFTEFYTTTGTLSPGYAQLPGDQSPQAKNTPWTLALYMQLPIPTGTARSGSPLFIAGASGSSIVITSGAQTTYPWVRLYWRYANNDVVDIQWNAPEADYDIGLLAITYDGGEATKIWWKGVLVASSDSFTNPRGYTSTGFYLRQYLNYSIHPRVYYCAYSEQCLDISNLVDNPWQIFKPDRPVSYFNLTGPTVPFVTVTGITSADFNGAASDDYSIPSTSKLRDEGVTTSYTKDIALNTRG